MILQMRNLWFISLVTALRTLGVARLNRLPQSCSIKSAVHIGITSHHMFTSEEIPCTLPLSGKEVWALDNYDSVNAT